MDQVPMALRPATDDDWTAMFGIPVPAEWFGLCLSRPWLIEGLGAIFLGQDGRWWIMFQRCPGVAKVKTAHAAAKRLLAMADGRGLKVHGFADPRISGAEMWMERLGFARTDEDIGGLKVWVRK